MPGKNFSGIKREPTRNSTYMRCSPHDLNPDHMVKRKSSQPSYSPDRSHKRPLDFRTRITTRARLYSYFWGLFTK